MGKGTIIDAVSKRLIDVGFEVFLTKEPTNSNLGNFLRTSEESYKGNALACVAAADRYFHIEKQIKPAIAEGKLVLSDRYVESSLVLQRMDGCSLDFIWGLHSQILIPDLSVILMAKASTLAARLALRSSLSRFERTETRVKELRFYREAGTFLTERGFNVAVFSNDAVSVEKLTDRIVTKIRKLQSTRRESSS